MSRTESTKQASLLPFLQPSNGAPRLALAEGETDATYPFAVVDDSAQFSRVIRGSFLTGAASLLKDVFLVQQRDHYRLENSTFVNATNIDIETSWHSISQRILSAAPGDGLIELTPGLCGDEQKRMFAPLLFCRERQLFMPVLCPSCARELELCLDDSLLQQKGLHPYATTARRYLYCPSCSNSEQSEFYVRERDDSDPIFLQDCMDLINRLALLPDNGVASSPFPCATCAERDSCFGPTNRVRSRLSPFSFYPFHLLIVDAPALNALDFTSLLSGASCGELSEQLDRRAFPGRFFSLEEVADAGTVKWTNFTQEDDRAFPELLFLKLSLLEEIVGKVAADTDCKLRGDRVWVYLSKICRNLPVGWNFRLLFMDDITPMPSAHVLERNPTMALARAGLLYFQILLGSRKVAANNIVEAVSHYLSDKSGEVEETGKSLLKNMCVPANIFRNPDGYVLNRIYEDAWNRACEAGYELLDAARGRSTVSCSEIHHSLQELLEVTRSNLFNTVQVQTVSKAAVTDRDDEQIKLTIHRVVSNMIARCRAEVRDKPTATPDDNFDEVVETVILRAGATPASLVVTAPTTSEDVATVIISSAPPVQGIAVNNFSDAAESELQETVIMSSQPLVQPVREAATPTSQPASAAVPEQDDDLAETVMITPAVGRNRPGGVR